MAQPYDYRIQQPQVSSYFDAFRQGRADQREMQAEKRSDALAQYLPGALQGNEQDKQRALASASPDQQIALSGHFAQMDAQTLAKTKENQSRLASMAAAATTPDAWTLVNAEAKKMFPGSPDIPFEQRAMVIAKAQTVSEQLDQVWKQKSYDLDASRTQAQNTASYASADASRASAERARMAPAKAPAGFVPGPLDADGNPTFVPKLNDEQAKATGFANRLQAANGLIDKFEAPLTSKFSQIKAGVPGVGNYLVPESYQQGDQAVRDFINAQLRRESGAVISEEEFDNARKQYIPQPGDGPNVLAQKREARALAFRNMRTSSGPGASQIESSQNGSAQTSTAPKVGQVINRNGESWRFLGGDPADKSRWRREP